MQMNYILNDHQARCRGTTQSDQCCNCRRRLQTEVDVPAMFYEYIGAAINPTGNCDNYLEHKKK